MHEMTEKARYPSFSGQGGNGHSRASVTTRHDHYSPGEPTALAVRKPGRGNGWPIVAKITRFAGSTVPILAVAWRGQRGTSSAISLPVAVLEYARGMGVREFYLRDDRIMRMWVCGLSKFQTGKLHADGERYIPLSCLDEVPWRDWVFAEQIVRLETEPERPAAQQLDLFAGAVP